MAIKDGKLTRNEGHQGEAGYRKRFVQETRPLLRKRRQVLIESPCWGCIVCRDIANLLSQIAHVLPDIEGMYFNLNDVPDHSITYGVRERSIALAKAGKGESFSVLPLLNSA
jgi:hypothetical protein